MGSHKIPMVMVGSVSRIGLALLLGYVVACVASSEVTMLEEGKDAKAGAKDEAPAAAANATSLKHGNKLQTVEERMAGAEKGSLAGEADPGYGLASASRTDLQRTHEEEQERIEQAQNKARRQKKPVEPNDPLEAADAKEAKHLEKYLWKKINGVAGGASKTDEEKARSAENIVQIARKAKLIKEKIKKAKQAVMDHMVKQSNDEQEAEAAAQQEQESEPTPEEKKQQAIEAEEAKLKAKDDKELGHAYTNDELFDKDEKIATHKSGNWADKTRDPNFRRWRPAKKDRKNPAAWRNEGDTPAAQRKP